MSTTPSKYDLMRAAQEKESAAFKVYLAASAEHTLAMREWLREYDEDQRQLSAKFAK